MNKKPVQLIPHGINSGSHKKMSISFDELLDLMDDVEELNNEGRLPTHLETHDSVAELFIKHYGSKKLDRSEWNYFWEN